MDGLSMTGVGASLERAAGAAHNDLAAGRISRLAKNADTSEPETVAKEIEALFATLLASEMRKGLGEGFFGSGPGSDTFNGWFDEEIGSSLASQGSLGLAKSVRESLMQSQAAQEAEAFRHEAEGRVPMGADEASATQGEAQ